MKWQRTRCRKKYLLSGIHSWPSVHPLSMSWHCIWYTEGQLSIFDKCCFFPASTKNCPKGSVQTAVLVPCVPLFFSLCCCLNGFLPSWPLKMQVACREEMHHLIELNLLSSSLSLSLYMYCTCRSDFLGNEWIILFVSHAKPCDT